MLSRVLLYEKDFTDPPDPPDYYEGEAFLQRKKENLEKLCAHMEANENKPKSDEDSPPEQDFEAFAFGDPKGNEVVLPCHPQTFLRLLKSCTRYARSVGGHIKLIRKEKQLIILIKAPYLTLNRDCFSFFSNILLYAANIDFFGSGIIDSIMLFKFHHFNAFCQTLTVDAFREMLAEANAIERF